MVSSDRTPAARGKVVAAAKRHVSRTLPEMLTVAFSAASLGAPASSQRALRRRGVVNGRAERRVFHLAARASAPTPPDDYWDWSKEDQTRALARQVNRGITPEIFRVHPTKSREVDNHSYVWEKEDQRVQLANNALGRYLKDVPVECPVSWVGDMHSVDGDIGCVESINAALNLLLSMTATKEEAAALTRVLVEAVGST